MNKAILLIIISLLCMAAVNAATIEVSQKHIFAGEEFRAVYTANAPLTEGEMVFTIPGQTVVINVPEMRSGRFTKEIVFVAPESPGEYEIFSRQASASFVVEKPLLRISKAEMEPFIINPGDTSQLVVALENVGDYAVYNVRMRIDVFGSPENYEYDKNDAFLFERMMPGESITKRSNIVAKNNAEGVENIILTISYEFNREEYTKQELVELQVGGFPLFEVIALILIMLVVVKFVMVHVAA